MVWHNINYYYINAMFKANITNACFNQIFIFVFAKHFVSILSTKLNVPKGNSNRMIVSVIKFHKTYTHIGLQNKAHAKFKIYFRRASVTSPTNTNENKNKYFTWKGRRNSPAS